MSSYNIDVNEFTKRLDSLKDMAAFNGGYVTKEDIEEAFPGLNDNQNNLIIEYLEKNRIGIGEAIDSDEFLTENDTGYLNLYLEELKELPEISESLKRVYTMGAINNEVEAKNQLINLYLSNVVDIAKLYAGQGVSLQDLIGEGNVALAIAVNMLECVDNQEDAEALIIKHIMSAMEETVGIENDNVQKDAKALELVIKVTDKAKEMYEELYRKVTVEELANESNISKKKILEAIRITDKCLEYIEKPESMED